MPVSYLSKDVKLTDYVQPFSLDLAQKALLYKQNEFDKGVAETQSMLDKNAAIDVYTLEDKEYLNQKLGVLQDNVNRLSGMDFSERSTSTQISGLSKIISGDERLVNAQNDTRNITALMQSAKKLEEKLGIYVGSIERRIRAEWKKKLPPKYKK